MKEKRAKILIVDDEKVNIDILVNLLKAHYTLVVAKCGDKAISLLESNEDKPDLILLDILMPGMDGYEVCRRIKENAQTKDIPVIFITLLSNVEEERYGFQLGAVDYITKPFSPPIVEARVKTHVELKRKRDLLEVMAREDVLTGIANRRKFDEFLDFTWNSAVRRQTQLSLVLIDIDFFKRFNDNYGHSAGDDCLREIALSLKAAMQRSLDLIARYGGEELACILPDTDGPGAMTVAKRLREVVCAMDIPHEHSDAADHVTISLGVTTMIPQCNSQPSALIEAADTALYMAKKTGRNRVEFLVRDDI
ncbi:MAG: diguanylate cyclase [Candidatus Magnetobacterium sp. LHC-1]|nr:diguanylate cyclase [Nitrospirota bacterium]